jgi:SAM-dependent methyltransferase
VAITNESRAPEDLVEPASQRKRRVPLPRAVKRRLRDFFYAFPPNRLTAREDVARMWLEGSGIEIGALNTALRVPPSVRVRYVDYLPIDELRQHHAHLLAIGADLVAPDVVDDGERLGTFRDRSQDFVIANHFMEHSEDPIGTLSAHLRVIRPGGMLFHAVPDKRRSFDWERPVTGVEHLIRDHEQGPEWSRQEHYREWAGLVDKVAPEEVERHAAEIAARRFSIHFHVWTPAAYLEFLLHCQSVGLPLEIVFFRENDVEFIAVMRRIE